MIGFDAFIRAARGHGAYPWQERLATRLADETADEPPPLAVVVPTGSGKTTVVDALVWALAAQAERPAVERTVGVRIVWAIDRRILVDEVHRQASELADLLQLALIAPTDPLHEVAVRLAGIKGEDPVSCPLLATRWRGGVTTPALAQHPLQAEVITSTVAQIGSRLLFRGYGLGDRSAPVGAALAACDTTVCLDEAHLAEAFAETATTVAKRARGPVPLTAPMRVIRLSATPSPGLSPDQIIDLEPEDLDTPQLQARITAPKWAALVDPDDESLPGQRNAFVEVVAALVGEERRTIACVLNTVRLARAVFGEVQKIDVDSVLLVGSQRPVDRERAFNRALMAEDGSQTTVRAVLFDGVRPARALVVVATQTFEVGLDVDVEALVTQSASASALAQRFGRLNRAGRLNDVDATPHADGDATIIRQKSAGLYAADEEAAWTWLLSELPRTADGAGVDVSVGALREVPPPPPAHVAMAPELTPAIEWLLAQTSPRPAPMIDPDIEPFLRGIHSESSEDVELCWRADLLPDNDSSDADVYREMLLRLVPPDRQEIVQVSLAAARMMLGVAAGSLSLTKANLASLQDVEDVDGASPPVPNTRFVGPLQDRGIPFFVRRGKDLLRGTGERAGADGELSIWQLRPGDRILIPTTTGGVDEHGFAPGSSGADDVAPDLVSLGASSDSTSARLPAVRLTTGALDAAFSAEITDDRQRARRVRALLRDAALVEQRLNDARTATGRAKVVRSLLDKLEGHPALDHLPAAYEGAELRRVGPRRAADVAELDEIALEVFGSEDTSEAEGSETSPESELSATLLESEEAVQPSRGWLLVAPALVSPDRVRTRNARPPTLDEHARAVEARASTYVRSLGLPERLARTITVAASAHDHGKADPRMQSFFRGGVALALSEPLAKSVFGTDDRRAEAAARAASGIQSRWRHELPSTVILRDAWERDPAAIGDIDLDLALLVILGHHGYGQPIVPVPGGGAASRSFHAEAAGIAGTCPPDAVEEWDIEGALSRREQLTDRFGAWALAYLVTLLVLADRSVSAEGG